MVKRSGSSSGGRGGAAGARGVRRRRAGFTLIEVLVVVAIIALLVSILLPSLSRAREMARATVCLTHMKEFGNAMAMYTMDHHDTLPGPLHPGMFIKVTDPPPLNPFAQTQHLPRMLKKYFSDKSKNTRSVVDELARCPSYPVADEAFLPINGVPRPFHYAVNTWTYTAPKTYYFGFIWLQFGTYQEWSDYVATKGGEAVFGPKRLGNIKNAQREWAMADAFRKPWPGEVAGLDVGMMRYGGHGSWQRDDPAKDNTAENSGQPIPLSPFHLGRGHKEENGTYVYLGRAQTLFFDSHAESQRGFRGTVNPSAAN
jgi:prepilin-type N-terminal cleavage/methylation domain-containing protein